MSLEQFQKSHHLIDPRHKIVYCYVAKNACSTIKFNFLRKKLRALGDQTPEDELNARLHILAKEHSILSEPPASFDDHYVFAIIREPHSRIASAFLDKFVQSKALPGYAKKLISNYGGDKDPDDWTFEDFINALAVSPIETLNEHWMPQYAHPIDGVTYDFIPMEYFSKHDRLLTHYQDLSVNVRAHSLQYAEIEQHAHLTPVRTLRSAFEHGGGVPGWRSLFHPSLEAPFLEVFQRDVELYELAKESAANNSLQVCRNQKPSAPVPGRKAEPAPALTDLQRTDARGALISVVVPVYNVERYIRDCMESLARQTDPNFEVVVVDDGSPDKSVEIIREYHKRIKNLVIHSQENRGLGGARNTGVKIANGEFIVFVDSDDTVTPNFVSSLRKSQIDGNHCVVTGRFQLVSEDLDFLRLTHEPAPPELDPPVTPHESVLGALARSVSCARLYRKRLLIDSGVEFPEGVPHEDLFYTYKILRLAQSVGECREYIYSWRQRQGSLGRSLTQAHIDILSRLRRDTYDYLKKVGASDREYAFAARRNLSLITWFRAKARKADPEVREAYFKMVAENLNEIAADLGKYQALKFPNDEIPAKVASLIKEVKRTTADSVNDGGASPIAVTTLSERGLPQLSGAPQYDFVFFPLRAYHLRECIPVARQLEKQGCKTAIIDSDEFRKGNEEVRKAAAEIGQPLISLEDFSTAGSGARIIVFLNDWDPLMRVISKKCHELGITTVGWVEGVNDYHDVDTGRRRYAYLRSQHVITPGEFDTKYFDDPRQEIHSGEVVRIRTLWTSRRTEHNIGEPPRALINSNFSYGVLEDKRDEWVRQAVAACEAAGFTPVISRHPFDLGREHAEYQTDNTFFDAVRECDVSIQRFGSGILESLATGVPVIYFNPHNEKIDKFAEPSGAYLCAENESALLRQLKAREFFWRESSAYEFLKLHTGLPSDADADLDGNRIADILSEISNNAPDANSGLAKYLKNNPNIRNRKMLAEEATSIGPFYGDNAAAPEINHACARADAGDSLISIILPVYCVEKYIDECIDSIAAQTDQNFELIIIDDGGTDRSIEKIKAKSGKFKALKIHSQKNSGLGAARNAGLDIAAGEFVVFVDSDDIITPGFIKKLRAKQVEGDYDIVSGKMDRITESGEQLPRSQEPAYPKVTPAISDYERTLGVLSPSVSCARLIRKSLLVQSGLRFPDRIPHEDLFFTYKLMRNATHGAVDTYIYRWRQRTTSLSKTFTRAHVDAWVEMRSDTERFLHAVNASERELAFAARRNLIILENFTKKSAEAPADVRNYFSETVSEYKDQIRLDIERIESSAIRHVYFPKHLAKRFSIRERRSAGKPLHGSNRPFYASAAEGIRTRAPQIFAVLQLIRRGLAGVWRRRKWAAPLAALVVAAFAASFLPPINAYRAVIWGGMAFGVAMLSIFYIALRTYQNITTLSARFDRLATEASNLKTTLNAERAARQKSVQDAKNATNSLILAQKKFESETKDAHSLLKASLANTAIAVRSNADVIKLALRDLSDAQRKQEGEFHAALDIVHKMQDTFKSAVTSSVADQRKEIAADIKSKLQRHVKILQGQIDALKKTSVAIDTVAALRALQPLLLEHAQAKRDHSHLEHGHSLLMDILVDEALREPDALNGRTLVEIGATREHHLNQKSTEKLAIFTALTNMKLITVDMDPDNIANVSKILPYLNPAASATAQKGEDFLAAFEGELDYVYLDAFDFDHDKHSDARRARYKEVLGTDINDEECWKMHESCALSVIEKMRLGGIVVFDDTWTDEDGGYAGKGKTALPLLLENGFVIVASTDNTIALKRTSA